MFYPPSVEFILSTLQNANYQAYLVGGSVRNHLLQRKVIDFDIATDAIPQRVQQIFADYRQLDYGKKHGTVTVLIDQIPVEITTFRQDGPYLDARHPEKVVFTRSLQDDLARRDFTINAFAMDIDGKILDYFEGKKDLDKGIIRAIGNPTTRFKEDALRILRAVRLSAELGFEIESQTFDAMCQTLPLLDQISSERKATELIRALMGDHIRKTLIDYHPIFASLCPDISLMKGFDQNNPHHIYDVLEHSAHVIHHCPKDRELRLAALFHDVGKVHSYTEDEQGIGHFYGHSEISEKIALQTMKKLNLDHRTIQNVALLIRYHDVQFPAQSKSVKRWLRRLGEDMFFKLLDLKIADNRSQAPQYFQRGELAEKMKRMAQEIIEENNCFQLSQLAINGHDLIKLGLSGKQIGQALDFTLQQVIDEKIHNDKSQLLQFVKEHYEQQ